MVYLSKSFFDIQDAFNIILKHIYTHSNNVYIYIYRVKYQGVETIIFYTKVNLKWAMIHSEIRGTNFLPGNSVMEGTIALQYNYTFNSPLW